jgi:hypothetical protein
MRTSHALEIHYLEQGIAAIDRLAAKMAAILRAEYELSQRLARCWACGADREPGDRGDCQRCGAGETRL